MKFEMTFKKNLWNLNWLLKIKTNKNKIMKVKLTLSNKLLKVKLNLKNKIKKVNLTFKKGLDKQFIKIRSRYHW